MLKQHATIYRRLMITADAVIAGICFVLAYHMESVSGELYPIEAYLWILPAFMILWGGLLYSEGMYASFRLKSLLEIAWLILWAVFFGFLILSSILFLFKATYFSRSLIVLIFGLTAFFTTLEKVTLILMFRYLRRKGFNFRNLLIVGTGPRVQRFIHSVDLHREFGFKIVGLVDEKLENGPQEVLGYKVIGDLNDIPKIVGEHAIDIVIFIVPRTWLGRIEESILYCETIGVSASVAVDFFDFKFSKGKEGRLFGFPLLTFERTTHKLFHLFLKRIIDVILSGVALIILSPFMALIAISIKTTSRGPALFRQERCGLNGRKFILYKFRTMEADAETKLEDLSQHNEMNGPVFKMTNDPRVIKVGRFLRKFSLDELPQLWNVFKGEMSLVGPRPPMLKEVTQYDHWQRRRLSMRPGITCLWQISGRSNITDFNEWMKLDLDYIDHWSLWSDFKIISKTIPVVLVGRGAK